MGAVNIRQKVCMGGGGVRLKAGVRATDQKTWLGEIGRADVSHNTKDRTLDHEQWVHDRARLLNTRATCSSHILQAHGRPPEHDTSGWHTEAVNPSDHDNALK